MTLKLLSGKDPRFPVVPFVELALLIAAMYAFFLFDPMHINSRLIELMRSRSDIFLREPRLLFYTYVHVSSFVAKTMAVLLMIVLCLFRKLDPERDVGIMPPTRASWKEWLIPFSLIAIILRLYYSNNPLVPNLPVRMLFPESMVIGNIVVITSIVLIAPITEELIFRGYMYSIFRKAWGHYVSIGATSALFALAHIRQLNYDPLDTSIIFFVGAAFGYLRFRTGSVLVPILFHSVYNAVYVTIGVANFMMMGY